MTKVMSRSGMQSMTPTQSSSIKDSSDWPLSDNAIIAEMSLSATNCSMHPVSVPAGSMSRGRSDRTEATNRPLAVSGLKQENIWNSRACEL